VQALPAIGGRIGEEGILTMLITASLRAVLPSVAMAITASAALADAAQDCRDATLTAEARQAACQTATGQAASYQDLAFTHMSADRPADALVAARRAVDIANSLTSDSLEEGLTTPHRAEEFGPWYEWAQSLLLEALARTGAVDEAITTYREAQAAGVSDTAGYRANGLAWGLYLAGEHETALPIIEEWLAAHPEPTGDEEYHSRVGTLAHILAALGRTEEAVQAFSRAVEIVGPEGPAYYTQGLTAAGFAPETGEEGFKAAIRACAAAGIACRLYD
jgi:tetratricopeptide (TPR) repeat protein